MSPVELDTSPLEPSKPTHRADERPSIPLPNGKVLKPRKQWAQEKGISDKTAGKIGAPTSYIGNVAYVVEPDATLKLVEHGRRRGRRW